MYSRGEHGTLEAPQKKGREEPNFHAPAPLHLAMSLNKGLPSQIMRVPMERIQKEFSTLFIDQSKAFNRSLSHASHFHANDAKPNSTPHKNTSF